LSLDVAEDGEHGRGAGRALSAPAESLQQEQRSAPVRSGSQPRSAPRGGAPARSGPTTSQGTVGSAGTAGGSQLSSGAKCCANCGTTRTSSWRRDPETQATLCSACGQYKKMNGRDRPVRLRNRAGADEARQCSHCGATDTSNWRRHPLTREYLCNACGAPRLLLALL
jgi:hypothetical protein